MKRDILLGAMIASILHLTAAVYSHWSKLPAPLRNTTAKLDPPQIHLFPPDPPDVTTDDDKKDPLLTPPPPVAPDPTVLPDKDDFVMKPDPMPPLDPGLKFASYTIPTTDFGASARRPFRIDEVDRAPQAVLQGPADYPATLKAQHVTGEVVVRFVVDASNNVRDVRVASSTAHGFDLAAVQAVQKWKFKAGTKAGKAVPVQLEVPIRFNLK